MLQNLCFRTYILKFPALLLYTTDTESGPDKNQSWTVVYQHWNPNRRKVIQLVPHIRYASIVLYESETRIKEEIA